MTKFLSEKIKFLSFILIILVVFIHAYTYKKVTRYEITFQKGFQWATEEFISEGIARIAVPLFFFLSGYLYFLNFKNSKQEIAYKLKKRLKTVLLPYLLWSVYAILLYFILQLIPKVTVFFSHEPVRDYSLKQLLKTIFLHPINYQLWFLRDLMVLIVFAPLLYFLIKYLRWALLICAATAWLCNTGLLKFSPEALLYFTLGAYLSYNNINLYYQRLNSYSYHFMALWFISIALRLLCVELKLVSVLENMLLSKISITIGLIAVWLFYDQLFQNKDVSKFKIYGIVSFSFFVYLFHEPVLTMIKTILFAFTGKSMAALLVVYFFAAFVTIFISLAAGFTLKKFLPPVYAFITGKR